LLIQPSVNALADISSSERTLSARAQPRARVLSAEDVGAEVVRRVVTRVLERATGRGPRLDEVALETVYAERTRLARSEANPLADADRAFIAWLLHGLTDADESRQRDLVAATVDHYVHEIEGHFAPEVYEIATRVVPAGLGLLLHGFALPIRQAIDSGDRICVDGAVDELRALARVGTVILAPTHVSNLDSLVLGASIHRLGLPPFAYGAGLNLFSNAIIGYFMRHLGGYTVDRSKTDPLYRQTLKEYSCALLERGQHSLFFPGGTRSRSGVVETKLKKGLLGTAPSAFRRALESGAPRPRIFVVPCTLTYPLVLEASSLIGEFLRSDGGPHYVDSRDEFDRPRRWLDFFLGLRQLDERVHLRISAPLDWLGNRVDPDGTSRDARGRPVDPARYLMADGQLKEDDARDAEYTRILAARIIDAYRRDNVVVPTGVVAFVVLEHIRRERGRPKLMHLLRSVDRESAIPVEAILVELQRALAELSRLEECGRISRSSDVSGRGPGAVLDQALATFATYHPTPVVERRGNGLHVGDPRLLFYYRNRLEGYGLLDASGLLPFEPGENQKT
jgi:glycerol-3-phosphate O-acyltransferase